MLHRFRDQLPRLALDVFVADSAAVIGRVTIGAGSSIWFGAVLRGDVEEITIGQETNIQDLSVVHADAGIPARVGDRVTVGHRAILHGCVVEDECVIGMGAIVQNGARVAGHAIVAAGSVVREGFEVPAGTLVAGVPARVKRALTGPEIEQIRELAGSYVERARLYSASRTGPRP